MTKYLLCLLLISATITIYDRDWRTSGYMVKKDKGRLIEVYNKDWSRKGYIKKEGRGYSIYDERWERKGYIRERK